MIIALTTQVVEADTGSQLLKDFLAFRLPAFHGGTDATVAKNWMLSIEKHFRSIGCADNHWVRLSTFMFRGNVERWWETTR